MGAFFHYRYRETPHETTRLNFAPSDLAKILHKKALRLKLYGDEVHYTACSQLVKFKD